MILGFKKSDDVLLTASLNIDFIRHDTTRKCFAIGEKGTLLWDGIQGQVKLFKKSSKDWEVIFSSNPGRNYTYMEEIKSFFSSIEFNKNPKISGKDGLEVVSIIQDIKESSKSNSIVYCQK